MKRISPQKRQLTVVLVVLAWLVIGLSMPLFLDARKADFSFDASGVVAAPRGHFQVGAPIQLHALTAAFIQSGRVVQIPPGGRVLTGSEANELLQSGNADLLLDRIDLAIGDYSGVGPIVDYSSSTTPAAPVVAALVTRRFASLTVRDSRVAVVLPSGRREQLTDVNLKVEPQGRAAITASGTANWRGHNVKLAIETQKVSDSGRSMPLKVTIEGELLSASFSGVVDKKGGLQFTGKADISAPSLRSLARLLGAAWPDGAGLEKVSLKGPINWTKASLSFPKAEVELDGNVGVGVIAIKSDITVPQLSGTLAFDQFNLSPYATAKPQTTAQTYSVWWDAITSAWSMPLARHFSADFRLSAKETLFDGYSMGKAAATISLKSGKFSAQLASLAFDGGSGSGQLTVDFNGLFPRTTVRGKLVNAPLGDIASALFGTRSVEGRATMTADLQAYGSDFAPMLENTSGTLKVDLEDGGAIGLDFNGFLSDESAADQREPSALLRNAMQGTTQVDRLNLDVKIDNGTVFCRKFVIAFDKSVARVAGDIDLRKRTADVRAVVHPEIPQSKDGIPVKYEPLQGHKIKLQGPWTSSKVALSKLVGGPHEFSAALLPERDQLR